MTKQHGNYQHEQDHGVLLHSPHKRRSEFQKEREHSPLALSVRRVAKRRITENRSVKDWFGVREDVERVRSVVGVVTTCTDTTEREIIAKGVGEDIIEYKR